MVAVGLATGNSRFREKLREKLEATGGVACKISSDPSNKTTTRGIRSHAGSKEFCSLRTELVTADAGACLSLYSLTASSHSLLVQKWLSIRQAED